MHVREPVVAGQSLALSNTIPIAPAPIARTKPPISQSILLQWLAPDVALTFAMLTLLALFFMFDGAHTLFGDSDTGWHIRTGEQILASRQLPRADPYSFSKPGQPWVAWEWASDVLMGAVFRLSGLAGVALLYGISIAAAVWMWFRLNRAVAGNFLLSFLFFVPLVSTTGLHWLARPHLFSWLFLIATVWLCEQMPERMPRHRRLRDLFLIAAGTALWANLHASFFLAPVIALIYATGAALKPFIWDCGEDRPEDERPHVDGLPQVRNFLWMALAAFVGSLANPGGWRLHRHVVSYLLDSALLDRISEFQSFNFHQDGALRVMLTLAICAAGAFAALSAGKPARFLLSLLLLGMALRSVRALPVAALLLLPLANGSLTTVLNGARGLAPALRRNLDGVLAYGGRLQAIDLNLRGWAMAPLVAILVFTSVRASAGFAPDAAPVAAATAIASLPPGARILAPDFFGGYLIYRFNGRRKVFFDGRSDFYGKEFLDGYLRMVETRPGWRIEFNRWNFTHVLMPPDCSLIPALEASGWHELFRDRTAVLLAGSSPL